MDFEFYEVCLESFPGELRGENGFPGIAYAGSVGEDLYAFACYVG